ncbi:MAG: hypothetical protein WAZ17_05955 [Thermovirgaceae bacterium]|nr:hypothetical protein [Synergistales bacterium]
MTSATSASVHIHIVSREEDRLDSSSLVFRLSEIWRDEGHRITQGPTESLEADIGIMNIDLTKVPKEMIPANPSGKPLLNSLILDISKRRISSNILSPDSSHQGEVIIKTDNNSFGLPERNIGKGRRLKGLVRSIVKRTLPWQYTRQLWYYKNYPVCKSIQDIPAWVWKREDLVVERFVPEKEGEEYSLRIWVFFGDQEYGVRMYGRNPIVKAGNRTGYEYLKEVPIELRAVRKRLGMDFGKFDYVVSDGEVILLDVNKTPTVAGNGAPSENLLRLASGINMYIERRGRS